MSRKPGAGWKRAAAAAVVLASAGVALSGCGFGSADEPSGDPGSPAAARGGQLTWGRQTEVQMLDPTVATDTGSKQVHNLVYESLLGVDDDLKPVPELASAWKQPSPTRYVFDIRRGVKFSTGREMTVADVVGSLRRLVDPKTAASWGGQLGKVRSVKPAGPWRVEVRLQEPRASFLAALANSSASVLPMRELRSGAFDPKKDLLGTGPFQIADHSQAESWTLTRNPHYWRQGEPRIDELIVRTMPEDAARVAALRDGSIDVATFDTPDAVRLLEGQPNIKAVTQESTDYYLLFVNAIASRFRDDRLREALALSLDRDRIRELALAGLGRPSAASPPSFDGGCDPAALPLSSPDLARARQLVDAVGARSETVSIMVSTENKTLAQIAQVIQENLEEIGLRVKIDQVDAGEHIKRLIQDKDGPFDVDVSYFSGLADPAMVLNWWNPTATGGWNSGWFREDEELNRLIAASLRAPDGPERERALEQTCARIAEEANIVPLVTKATIIGYRTDQVSPRIQPVEGFGIPLRGIAQFSVK